MNPEYFGKDDSPWVTITRLRDERDMAQRRLAMAKLLIQQVLADGVVLFSWADAAEEFLKQLES